MKSKLRNYKAHGDKWNMRQMLMPYEYRVKFYRIVDLLAPDSIEQVVMHLIDQYIKENKLE